VLWDAGQQRLAREGRERLAELYVGVRDGIVAADVATGRAKTRGDIRPSYVRGDDRPEPLRTPAQRDMALASLAAAFPGMVRRGDS